MPTVFGKNSIASWSTRFAAAVADLVLPRTCAACGAAIGLEEADLCTSCAIELQAAVTGIYCRHCGEDRGDYLLHDGRCTRCVTKKPRPGFEAFARVGRYEASLKAVVLRFKREFFLDRFLGRLLGGAIRGRIDPAQVDLWVPIPSHWRRRLSVGYQPAALLAGAAVRAWRGRVTPALAMTRYVPPFHLQQGMSAAERAEAVAGAFAVVEADAVKDSSICLIDDVTTTGATLSEARRALQKAGAKWVAAAVLAKTSRHGPASGGVDRSSAAR